MLQPKKIFWIIWTDIYIMLLSLLLQRLVLSPKPTVFVIPFEMTGGILHYPTYLTMYH